MSAGIKIVVGQLECATEFVQGPFAGVNFRKKHVSELFINPLELLPEHDSSVSKMTATLGHLRLSLFIGTNDALGRFQAALLLPLNFGQWKQQILRQLFAAEKA